MGFTIANYSLFGLQPQNFYVSIHGTFQIRKDPNCYVVIYTVYYHAMVNSPVITQKDMCFSLQELPEPANIYTVIYNEIKKNIDPDNILSIIDDS
jgi:hypothetical protein